jgi:hypothetical protein
MKITKRQLRKIIKEEKNRFLLKEQRGTIGDIFSQAAAALENRNGAAIENIILDTQGLMIPVDQLNAYLTALQSMADAAYELEIYENE